MNATSGLITDLYELTMAQGYYLRGRNPYAVFDLFFRSNPFGGGYALLSGIDPAVDIITSLQFEQSDIEYLASLGYFRQDFLDYLRSFSFSGSIYTVEEGRAVFPNEPVVRIHAPLVEAQLIESILLNIVNFQTLIATKASRVCNAAEGKTVLEFGLRRAQGLDGALSASRAAYIGGAAATSNTYAGKTLGIPVSGTMAHSWVMSFESELESFRTFAELYPQNALLLIDTYETLGSGIENAIIVGRELRDRRSHEDSNENSGLFGVRIDSGNLEELSRGARARLDEAGLTEAIIVASNELDEHAIEKLVQNDAPIDAWGVGTNLVTGGDDASLTGVYKLSAVRTNDSFKPLMKVSDDPAKSTQPGVKQIHRVTDPKTGMYVNDLIALCEKIEENDELCRSNDPPPDHSEPLLKHIVESGRRLRQPEKISRLQARAKEDLGKMKPGICALSGSESYPVELSQPLAALKKKLSQRTNG